jgi:hypothetical protein
MYGTRGTTGSIAAQAKASPRSRQAELLILCARLGFNP